MTGSVFAFFWCCFCFFLKDNTDEKHCEERKHSFDLCGILGSVPRIAGNEGVNKCLGT